MREIISLLARPLLFASREDIERYAEAKGLAFSTDSTNAEDRYARNRIRHALVPLLDGEFNGWRRGLLGSAEKLKADRDALRRCYKRALKECGFAKRPRGAAFDLAGFLSQPEALKVRILARAAAAAGIEGRLPYRALRSAALAVSRGAKAVDLAGARLRTLGERVEILPILDFHREDKYFFQILSEGLYHCGSISLEVFWEPEGAREANAPPRRAAEPSGSLLEGSFSFPLRVRSRMPGDAIFCSGAPRRLDGLLSSWRVDPRDKDLIPIVEDRDGIVAALAGALDRPLRGKGALRRDKFRDYGGDGNGRRLFIRIKGA
jgi:tRNA(Ile)-lysidine synthase